MAYQSFFIVSVSRPVIFWIMSVDMPSARAFRAISSCLAMGYSLEEAIRKAAL